MVLVMVLFLAKQIITLYHAIQKTLTKDQHALVCKENVGVFTGELNRKKADHGGRQKLVLLVDA